jgi:hypothetical protein
VEIGLLEETVPVTPPPAEEIRVLEQASRAVCAGTVPESLNPVGPIVDGPYFVLACVYAAGHATSIRIERYEDSEAALLVFQGGVEGRNVEDFHGYPSVEWESVFPVPGSEGRERVFQWQVGRWVVKVASSDDTAYRVSRDPREVSDIVYEEMVELGLVDGNKEE